MFLNRILMTAENTSLTKLKDPRLWPLFGFTGPMTASGQAITPDSALTLSAYYTGIRIISEDLAKLPFVTFERLEPRGKRRAPEHPVYSLLKMTPNRNMTSFAFRETLTAHAVGWGGGFALIRRDRAGNATELDLIHPSRVETAFTESDDLFYMVALGRQGSQKRVVILQEDMFHVHGLSPDGINGYSVARVGAESLGRGMAAERFSASFFRSGSAPTGVLSHPMIFKDEDAIRRLREQWTNTYTGEQGWHKPIVLEQGMQWQQITIPPEDAQLLETEKFSVLDIARWLRIAPHKLAELEFATFSNIEEQNIDHVVDTLMPWMRRWEEEAARKLFVDDDKFFAEHVVQALLRGNLEARGTFYREQFNIGAMSQNDIRERENLNPIEGGDTYYINSTMVRSEDAAKGMTAGTIAAPARGRSDGNDAGGNQRARGIFYREQFNAGAMSQNDIREREKRNQEQIADLVNDCLIRCQAKETCAINAARVKHQGKAFDRWVKGFYHRHRSYLVKQLTPTLTAIGVLCDIRFAKSALEKWAGDYVNCVLKADGAESMAQRMDEGNSKLIGQVLLYCEGKYEDET